MPCASIPYRCPQITECRFPCSSYMEDQSDIDVRQHHQSLVYRRSHEDHHHRQKIAFVGGMNIGREYRYDWHDSDDGSYRTGRRSIAVRIRQSLGKSRYFRRLCEFRRVRKGRNKKMPQRLAIRFVFCRRETSIQTFTKPRLRQFKVHRNSSLSKTPTSPTTGQFTSWPRLADEVWTCG